MSSEEILYSELIPGLGERALPMLFARLKEAAEAGNRYLARQIVKGIASIRPGDGGGRARDLLENPSPRIQRAGMLVLAEIPDPSALGRLWELHCQGQVEPAPFLYEHDRPWLLYEDSYGALRSCSRVDSDWLERAISRANPDTEPVHDLAYLVSGVNDDGALWRRCKSQLRAKLPEAKERSFASNVLQYQDADEVEWLLARVSRADDLVGPVAFHALVRIDERLALDHLEDIPERELYFTRKWCLQELLVRRPVETRGRLLRRLQEHPDPWQFAMVFQDVENAMNVPILNHLLDALEPLLRAEIEHGLPANRGSVVWLSCGILDKLAAVELLNCLRQRRGSRLERGLVDWLLWRGPQNSGFVEHDKQNAMAILTKIGGEGLATVVNDWLARGNRFSRLDAMKLSVRRWNAETVQRLREQTLNEELWDGHAVEQGYAADALATMREWQHVIRYHVQWGLNTLTRATMHHWEVQRLDDEAMAPALERVNVSQPLEPGVAMALAFGHRNECLDAIHDALASVAPDSEIAHACVIAMWWLCDQSEVAVSLLAKQLLVPSHRHNAINALLANATDEAVAILLEHIRKEYDFLVAAILTSDKRARDQAMSLVRQSLATRHSLDSEVEIRGLLRKVKDTTALQAMFSDPDVQELIRQTATCQEGAAWFTGTKATAIRALALIDPGSAYVAARAALQNEGFHDREMYPYVLVQIDAARSIGDLIAQAKEEQRTSVRWSIARALSNIDCLEAIKAMIASADQNDRKSGCILCEHGTFGGDLEEGLKRLLRDPSADVARAAREALEAIESRRNTEQLVQAILEEEDISHRWTLLDAAIASADPGDEGQPWPEWAQRIADALPFAMRRDLDEGISKRRKEIRENADKCDR